MGMKINETLFKDVFVIDLEPVIDSRGLFVRSFCKNELLECGLQKEIVQINQSTTKKSGSFRGFHYQKSPFRETKIVRCISGKVLDIIIDLRAGSETFLKSFEVELSSDNFKMIYIPEGFAHGFQTLSSDCSLLYLHTEFYNPQSEAGLNYTDPRLKIKLPLEVTQISDRDKNFKYLKSDFNGL
jgi:dTDP-4-dehydrorhamnose 3,5-epimerase